MYNDICGWKQLLLARLWMAYMYVHVDMCVYTYGTEVLDNISLHVNLIVHVLYMYIRMI